jgi:prephenate dehydrogenase
VAAGHPGIWLDICSENRDSIVGVLDRLEGALRAMRDVVARGDRDGLVATLDHARRARMNLPTAGARPEDLAEFRVPVPDRPGVLAEVTTLAGELDVNIYDLEIVHSAEGGGGVLVFLVARSAADLLRGALMARHYRPAVSALS